MTTKKSKVNSITHKTDFKYRLKEVQKKNQNTNRELRHFYLFQMKKTHKTN